MGILVEDRHRSCFQEGVMQATFFQKVIICAIAGFLAAALLEWGKMFVTGADDALNKGYKHTAPGVSLKSKP
jgi:nucleoside recognition membrane protein YjiH